MQGTEASLRVWSSPEYLKLSEKKSVVFCTSLTSALPLVSFLQVWFLIIQCRRYGVGGGMFTADVNICTVEAEGMIGEYCNSWYKCCTLTVKLKNLCNLNEV